MMRVVEEEDIRAAVCPVTSDSCDQMAIGPFVNHDQIGVANRIIQIERRQVVRVAVKPRIGPVKGVDSDIAMVPEEVSPAPAVLWLEDPHGTVAVDELLHDTA
jgi:hypothetical protein